MKKELEYKSTIKSMPFLYLETKKAAGLILQGFKEFEIKDKAINENIFQVNTEARKKEIASIVLRRLKILDEYLMQKLVNGSVETSKLIVIYAIMKSDRLFFEFLNEVYREKILIKDFSLTDKDLNIYFERKKEQSQKVAAWNDYTFYKLKQVFIRILFEAGLIKKGKEAHEIIKPIIEEDLARHLRNIGDEVYLKILTGEM